MIGVHEIKYLVIAFLLKGFLPVLVAPYKQYHILTECKVDTKQHLLFFVPL